MRDNDAKFGKAFDELAESTGIKVLKTPNAAPKANALCESFSEVYARNVWILLI